MATVTHSGGHGAANRVPLTTPSPSKIQAQRMQFCHPQSVRRMLLFRTNSRTAHNNSEGSGVGLTAAAAAAQIFCSLTCSSRVQKGTNKNRRHWTHDYPSSCENKRNATTTHASWQLATHDVFCSQIAVFVGMF